MFTVVGYCHTNKSFGLIPILVFLWMGAFAQAPSGINYQGVARNPDGSPHVNQSISFRVSILAGGLNGVVEYVETHAVTTNQFGLFTIVIGQGVPTGSLQDVDWQNGNKWLQIEMDVQGGNNFELVGAQQIFSVPYAMYASKSGTGLTAGDGIDVTGGVISNTKPDTQVSLLGAGTVSVSGTYPDYVITGIEGKPTLTDVLIQDNDAGNMTISNLAEPANIQDAATKSYVDTRSVDDADADPANEIQNASQVVVTPAGNLTSAQVQLALEELQADIDTDLDADPANEIQDLGSTISGTQRTITISGGASTTIDVADGDNDAANELQSLSQMGNDITLSNGGGTVSVDDGDSDPTNEIQDMNLSVNTLSLTDDASTVDLSGYLDNTDNQNLTFDIVTGQLDISGGNFVTITDIDATNELNTGGSFVANNTIRIVDAGGNTDIALGTLNADMNANTNRIINVADPVDPGDVVNLSFLEAKDATDYAISVGISYTSSGAGDVALDLSGASLDKGGLIIGSTITITEDGVYSISVQGYSLFALGSDIDITIQGFGSPVLRGDNNYLGTYLFDLVAGDQIEIIVKFTVGGETINLQISVYKI